MQTMPIDVVDQSYESRSKPLSVQVTRNMYPELVTTGKTNKALHSWPGKKSFATGSGANRGIMPHPWNGNVYTVDGTTLYKTNSAGTKTSLGTIAGSGRCIILDTPNYVYIVASGSVYRTDGTTLSSVTDADLESPDSAAFLRSFVIYNGNQGRFVVSDAGDGGTINALNYATAEALPDDLIRVFSFGDLVYMLGERSIETWYASGSGSPPFDIVQGGVIYVGIAGVYCICNTSNFIYFLGSDRSIYRLQATQEQQISTAAINHAIEGYSTVSDCFATTVKIEGQNFIDFTFPTANKTWRYSEATNTWMEGSSGVAGGRDLANGYCYAFGKKLVTDYQNGNIYEIDIDTYDDAGAAFIRERVVRPITSIDLGQPGKRLIMSRFELIIEAGVGLVTGQGSAPVFMMSHSTDGGRTWSAETWVSPGALGDYTAKLEYFTFASGYEITIKIRVSDPVNVSIHSAAADIDYAGY